jgi:hypothetical protein
MTTQETATSAECNSNFPLGRVLAGAYVPIWRHPGNNYSARGWSGGATGDLGASGAPLPPVASDE